MYSIYEGFFYGDYYSEAVMCGTMSDMKRVTRKYVLEYVHTWYMVRSWNYIYVAMLWSRLSQMRHNRLQFGRIVNHIFIKSYLSINTTAAHPLQSHTPSSSIQYIASITQ